TKFFSAGERLCVTEAQRQEAIALCQQAGKLPSLEAMQSFGLTDFRDDLKNVTVPTLVIHGDSDAVVPFEGSGKRTHEALPGSQLVVIDG
ncbi:alpha/beta fold hydrolase, partial [Escherichia coli]|uniref:alpha/beta fold hydrolase n=1 Tax=Escherichia coli TaxID=562 RepID=UPI003A97E529